MTDSTGNARSECAEATPRGKGRGRARTCMFLMGMWIGCSAGAAELNWDDVVGELAVPVMQNLDLSAWGEVDVAQLQGVCRQVQERLQGEYVVELAPLREVAHALLPLMEQHAELQPYASWLRTRLDYLVVADELRIAIPPPSLELRPKPLPPINPRPELEREIWVKKLALRPILPRAEMYVPKLKPIFAAEGVPVELVWVAEVESAFDPQAKSPVGAAGLFQLMPATAEWLGLELQPGDQRLDPEKGGRAAAKYLKYLHGKFADWQLVLAAYNGGEGRVRRLMEKHEARRFDDIAQYLPAETQMYVPKVEATILRREGVTLADLGSRRR